MTIIKGSTKKGMAMVASAKYNKGYYLNDVYDSFSSAKYNAWLWCLNRCREEGGKNFRITSNNTFGFSVAWDVSNGVRIETPKNSYLIMC